MDRKDFLLVEEIILTRPLQGNEAFKLDVVCLTFPSDLVLESVKSGELDFEEYFEDHCINNSYVIAKETLHNLYMDIGKIIANMEKENATSQRKKSKVKKGRL